MRIKIEKISRNYARDFERASEWMTVIIFRAFEAVASDHDISEWKC